MQMHKKHIALATLALAAIAHPAHAQISSPPPAEASFTVSGYAVEGDNPLGEAQTQAALAPFVGQHVGIERLQQAATALETLLRENGYGFYRVVLPPQDIGGVIRLQMFRFTVGTVEIKGNQFFSNDNILRSLPQLATGSSPNTNALARDLALANENPSKRVNVTFRQGQLDDTVDASVDVKDSRTVSAFVLLNNTGTAQTGNGRLTLGASHANLFDKDHQATFTYTTSPTEPGRVHQWGGYYRAPLYDHGAMVSGYYTTSSVSSGVVANTINVTGRGDFAGIAVSYYLAPKGDYRSYLTLGLDDKHFRNDKITTLGGAALFPNYRTRPLTLSYTGRFQKQWGQWGYNLEYAHNLSSGGATTTQPMGPTARVRRPAGTPCATVSMSPSRCPRSGCSWPGCGGRTAAMRWCRASSSASAALCPCVDCPNGCCPAIPGIGAISSSGRRHWPRTCACWCSTTSAGSAATTMPPCRRPRSARSDSACAGAWASSCRPAWTWATCSAGAASCRPAPRATGRT